MRVKSNELALTAVCTVLGALLMVQLKTQQNLRLALPTHNASDLALMLREQQQTREALEKEIVQVRAERHSLDVQTQLRRLKGLLGLTVAEGPGIRVVLSAKLAKGLSAPKGAPEDYVDPLWVDTVVNELWSAGAEAVSVNDQRVVTNTGIGPAADGDAVMVNGRSVSSPFTILGIGDPMTLDSALRMRNSAVDLLRFWDLNVSLTQQDRVVIPAYADQLHYTFISTPSTQERQ